MMKFHNCSYCHKDLDASEAYEYRGVISCSDHFEKVCESRDRQRSEIINEESHKTDQLQGLVLDDSALGKANRKLLKPAIEIASKKSQRLKNYERNNQSEIPFQYRGKQ